MIASIRAAAATLSTSPMPAPATAQAASPKDTVTLGAGPVPDYAPMAGVVAHVLARSIASPMVAALFNALGSRADLKSHGDGGPRGAVDTTLVWMRDYHPMFARQVDGSLKVVRFLNENPTRSMFSASTYVPVKGPSPRHQMFETPGGDRRWLETAQVPLLHQVGNQVASGRHVFVTEALLADNARPHEARHLKEAGFEPRDAETVVSRLAEGIGAPRESIVVLPRMPGEKTGHVDMFLMALDDKTIMIPQIRDDGMQAITYGHERELGSQVRDFLEARAAQIRDLGYEVVRLPMLPPVFLSPREGGGWNGVFYSPANGLLLNDGASREALLPTFQAEGFPAEYKALNEKYQAEWSDTLQTHGWQARLVDATELGRAYGLFRCITYPIPR